VRRERMRRGCLGVVIRLAVVILLVIAVAASLMSLIGGGGSSGGGGVGGGSGGEEKPDKVVARASGTEGIKFFGNVGTLDEDRAVEGTVPASYPIKGFDTSERSTDTVTMVAQKYGRQGKLTCQIVVGGEVVKQASTTANYGTCTVTWSPVQ
jgi:hypothetical protein